MKHRIPDSADHSILRHKLKGIEQCSRSLYYKCADNDLFYHADHSAQLIHIIGFLENHPLLYCNFFSQYQEKCSSTSYDSQTTDLDQDQKDHLPKKRKLYCRRNSYQPGHANRRHRSKQSIHKRNRLPVTYRKPQKKASQKYNSQKTKDKYLHGVPSDTPFFAMHIFCLLFFALWYAPKKQG